MGSMGSTDKTMVALVALEQVKRGEASLEDEVTVTAQDREIELLSIDEPLFTHLPATGVKTGTTPGAGSSLVATAAAEDEAYVSVILEAREAAPRPRSGRWSTGSPPTTARRSSPGAKSTPKLTCPTAGERGWASWQERASRAS